MAHSNKLKGLGNFDVQKVKMKMFFKERSFAMWLLQLEQLQLLQQLQ
jgi:hypothetical protein